MEADELLVPKMTNKGSVFLAVFWISRGGRGAKHANACNVLSDLVMVTSCTLRNSYTHNRSTRCSLVLCYFSSYNLASEKTLLFYPTSSNHKELTGTRLRGLLGRGVIYLSTPARRRGYRAAHLQFLNKFNELKDIEHIISK